MKKTSFPALYGHLDLEKFQASPPPKRSAIRQDMKHDLHFLALPLNTFPYSHEKRTNCWSCPSPSAYIEGKRSEIIYFVLAAQNSSQDLNILRSLEFVGSRLFKWSQYVCVAYTRRYLLIQSMRKVIVAEDSREFYPVYNSVAITWSIKANPY